MHSDNKYVIGQLMSHDAEISYFFVCFEENMAL